MRVYFLGRDIVDTTELEVSSLESAPRLDLAEDDSRPLMDVLDAAVQDLPEEVRSAVSAGTAKLWMLSILDIGPSIAVARPVGMGPLFGIDDDGLLVMSHRLLKEISVAEMSRAMDAGYYEGSASDLLYAPAWGFGGNGAWVGDVVQWLADNLETVLVAYAGTKAIDHTLGHRDRMVIQLADSWARRRIDSPRALRTWLECKTAWQVREVADRLGLNEEAAEELLRSVGFETSDHGVMELRSSLDALQSRDHWVVTETFRFMDDVDDWGRP